MEIAPVIMDGSNNPRQQHPPHHLPYRESGEQKRKEFTWAGVSRIHARQQIAPQARVNAEIQLSFPIERTASIARPPARRAARLYSDARACVEGTADGWRAAAIMVSGGGSREAGRKRKAAASPEAAAMRREPRRGLGVAELERIRVALEVADRCYAAVPPLPAPHPLALPPSAPAVVHGAGLAAVRQRHEFVTHVRAEDSQIISHDGDMRDPDVQVGNGAVHQLQMPRGSFPPYYVATQQYESFTRLPDTHSKT